MPSIHVLPDELVNRIAAGEVVERPSSVVKELVENSLDAGAGRIEVELDAGGRSLVRVSDDGCGMDWDDALLALERHATSKIRSGDDLHNIASLGFRGEALPSIAAASRLTLHTCADPAQGGVRVRVEGGRILGVEGVARAVGTTVEVRDLFFNLPARRKFLHAPETELRHAQEALWSAALSRPGVGFRLRHRARVLLEVAPARDAQRRFGDLLRRRGVAEVHRFASEGGGVRVTGLLALTGGSSRPQITFLVNGRAVRDRLLVGAVMRALRAEGRGLGGARLAVLVEIPGDAVDVNVHPAKTEVRFARAGAVGSLLERAVRSGVAAARGRIEVRTSAAAGGPMRVAEPAARYAARTAPSPGLFPHPVFDREAEGGLVGAGSGLHPAPRPWPASGEADTPFGRLVGQYRSSFLLVEDDEGLVIVDQHVAHERVLYDRIRRRREGTPLPAQQLLQPLLVEVGEARAEALDRVAELLCGVGLEVERFGSETVRVLAVPLELGAEAARQVLLDLLERATAFDDEPERVAEALEDELVASLACRAAVKVNHPLAVEEQRTLLRDLAASDNPYRCPHGRPILLRVSQEEMERRLGRR